MHLGLFTCPGGYYFLQKLKSACKICENETTSKIGMSVYKFFVLGSSMAYCLSQVNEIVIAYLIPDVTFST